MLAKLLNAGVNEWLLAPAQPVQLCPETLGVVYFILFYLFLSQAGAQSTAPNQQGNNPWMISPMVIFTYWNIKLAFNETLERLE